MPRPEIYPSNQIGRHVACDSRSCMVQKPHAPVAQFLANVEDLVATPFSKGTYWATTGTQASPIVPKFDSNGRLTMMIPRYRRTMTPRVPQGVLQPLVVPQVPLAEPNPGPKTRAGVLAAKQAYQNFKNAKKNNKKQALRAFQRSVNVMKQPLVPSIPVVSMRAAEFNNASSSVLRNDPNSGSMRLKHREYIADVSTTGAAFASTFYAINPGVYNSFPWLSGLAVNFDRYRFNQLRYYYRATSATAVNSTNTALGVVVMAVQYDTYDPAFSSKVQMETNAGAVSTEPALSAYCNVACARAEKLYVRNLASGVEGDQRVTDIGTLTIATQGQQASATIGELWVEYDVSLFQPRVPFADESDNSYSHSNITPVSGSDAFGSMTTLASSNLTVTRTGNNAATVSGTVPGGVYTFVYAANAATSITNNTYVSVSTGGTSVNAVADSTANAHTNHNYAGSTTTSFMAVSTYLCTATTMTIAIANLTIVGACFADLWVFGGVSSVGVPRTIKSRLDQLEEFVMHARDESKSLRHDKETKDDIPESCKYVLVKA